MPVLQAHRNSVARDALASEFGLLSSSEVVAELSMSARLKCRRHLAVLQDRLGPWSLALWFTGDNSRFHPFTPIGVPGPVPVL